MTEVFIIDNENTIACFINEGIAKVSVYDDVVCALNAIEISKPPIILVNQNIHKDSIAEYISILSNASRDSRIVLIGSELTDEDILDCLASGSKGYLQINEVEPLINKLINVIIAGEAWISRRLVLKLLERLNRQKVMESALLV